MVRTHAPDGASALVAVAVSILAGVGCAGSGEATRPAQQRARAATSGAASAAGSEPARAKAFETKLVVLYQPDGVLRARVPDVPALAAYMKTVESTCNTFFAGASRPQALDVVVAIKPVRQSRVWFIGGPPRDDEPELASLKRELESLAAPPIQSGPVAFAIVGSIAGAPRSDVDPETFRAPLPSEWHDAVATRQRATLPDDALMVVWPDPH